MQEPIPIVKVFYGDNYEIGLISDGSFVLDEHIGCEEFFASFDEIVEQYPYCEEARSFFCSQGILGLVGRLLRRVI